VRQRAILPDAPPGWVDSERGDPEHAC